MNEYFNAQEGTIELPVPGGLGVRTLVPGQSFYGPVFYDRFLTQGMLAKLNSTRGQVRGFVTGADFTSNSQLSDSSGPARYKQVNGTTTSLNKMKYSMSVSLDTKPGDNVLVIYYFYTNYANAATPTHVIPRYEPMVPGWRFPVWAPLPSDFYSLGPIEQFEALMQTA